MPEKRAKTPTTPRKSAPAPRKRRPEPAPAAAASTPDVAAPQASDVCPRCGTAKFGPEQRTRAEGTRMVRYTVLVCERGHTFARPRSR